MARMKYRWRVPGNGNPFDTKLEDWNRIPNKKMSERSIGVLEYISEQIIVEIPQFKFEIKTYLNENYGHEINKSEDTHFYRPLEFLGFIRNRDNKLSLSIDGKNFLREIHNKDYDKAIDYYILMLFKSSYPNTAAKGIALSLFPFRIIFKMLLEQPIPLEWFLTKIPYIKSYDDITNIGSLEGPPYSKWKTWVLPYLEKWNIIGFENEKVVLLDYKKDLISSLLSNMEYKDMFFETEQEFDYIKNKIRCKPRDPSIIASVLKENEYSCFFNKTHETFPTNTKPNYVEGHHIIPISLNDSFKEELDCKENIIALCPNCHKAIHYATAEHKQVLLEKILNEDNAFSKFNLDIEDMKEIYFNKKVPIKS